MGSRKRRPSTVIDSNQPSVDSLEQFQLQLLRRDYQWRRVLFCWTFTGRNGDLDPYQHDSMAVE